MTEDRLLGIIKGNAKHPNCAVTIWDAVQQYISSQNSGKPIVICRSSFGRELKVGQLVCSYGDETTVGRIRYWDEAEQCWSIELITGTKACVWWPNDEPQPISENGI
jgi:hypothetical protein